MERAKALGLSRSEFSTRAVDNYLDQLDAQSATRQIDAALERLGAVDDSNSAAVAAAHQVLTDPEDEW